MEFLQQKLAQVKESWGHLSASGRLALALAVILAVAALVIVSQNAGSPDLVPLPTNFEPDELATAVGALRAQGVECDVKGNQILVPSAKRHLALGMLAFSNAMPQSGISAEKMLESGSIFEPESDKQRKARYLVKRELELSISEMPGVRGATVLVNHGTTRTLRRTPEGASASLGVNMASGSPLTKPLARSMASYVAGSVHGLKLESITVVDKSTGQMFDFSAESQLYDSNYVNLIKTYRAYFQGELERHFSNIRGIHIGVHVVPNLDRTKEHVYTVEGSKVIDGLIRESSSTSTGGSASGDVGVTANTGDGGSGSATAATDTTTESEIGNPTDYPRTTRVTSITPGVVETISAAIQIPRSYLERVARIDMGEAGKTAEGEEPKPIDQAAIDNVMAKMKLRIASQAAKILGSKPDDVDVDWMYDGDGEGVVLAMASAGPGMLAMIERYWPTGALGLFGVLALFMVYSVVRKFQPAEVPADVPDVESVGEAGLTLDSILEGVELEADTIRASKMQEQISNMVKEDPDSVANLLKRWVVQE
jgi:flagellar M-ring protein FliF